MNNIFTEPFGQPNIIYKLYYYNKQFLEDWVQLWSENRKQKKREKREKLWCGDAEARSLGSYYFWLLRSYVPYNLLGKNTEGIIFKNQ